MLSVQLLTLVLTPEQIKANAKIAKKLSQPATTLMAAGTISSHLLLSLGISSERRQMVMMLMTEEKAGEYLELLSKQLALNKPGHGIAFLTRVIACVGNHNGTKVTYMGEGEDRMTYHKITVIVDRGKAEEVMNAAREAGARGGTILHGRGSTAKDAQKIFGIEIEPEKEVVVILAPQGVSKHIFETVSERMHLDEHGKGIMFVEPVEQSVGLYEESAQADC